MSAQARRALLAAATFAVALLAGCAGDDGGDGADRSKGAIAGLLLDDRFRPIQLTNDPQSEFQAAGFVLLQETGEQTLTTANGEFAFSGLEPGTYTLRAQAEGHEAVPQRVTVRAGEFAETSIVARRTASEGSVILTQEFSVFIDCEATLLVYGTAVPCTADLSGDTTRDGFVADYTGFPTATFMVTEFLANQDGFYEIRLTPESEDCSENYAIEEIVDDRYLHIVNEKGVPRLENALSCGNYAWDNDRPFVTVLFVDGMFKHDPVLDGFGVGAYVAIKGKFIQSVFLGEPDVDPATYCVLC